jgi:hypothetical protein
MEPADWIERVKALVRELGDRDYQYRTWLGHDPCKVSSPAEMCCRLFDDLYFAETVILPELHLREEQKFAALDLLAAIDACSVADDLIPPAEVLDHPAWVRVRIKAQRLSDLLQE